MSLGILPPEDRSRSEVIRIHDQPLVVTRYEAALELLVSRPARSF